MYTLAEATRRAQLRAAELGEAVYVVEVANSDDDKMLLPPQLTAEDWAVAEEMAREAAENAALWEEHPAVAGACGLLPPWPEDTEILSAEDYLIRAGFTDPSDPVSFSAMMGDTIALLMADGFDPPLLRVATPDGTLAVVRDPVEECKEVFERHGGFVEAHHPSAEPMTPERAAALRARLDTLWSKNTGVSDAGQRGADVG